MKDHRPIELPEPALMSHEGPATHSPAPVFARLRPSFLATHLLLLLGLDAGLSLAFIGGGMATAQFVALHLGLCVASAAWGWAWLRVSHGRDQLGTVLLVAIWTVVAGPFGPVMAIGLLVPQRRRAFLPGDGAEAALSLQEQVHGSLLDQRLRLNHAHGVTALLDVFIDGSQIEKFNALRLISKRYDATLAPALQRALADRDGSVRVLAATVMAQQQNHFTKRIGALRTAAEARPETARQWRELGQAHSDYASSNLLERSRAETELGEALACLVRAAQIAPLDADIQKALHTVHGSWHAA